MDKSIYFINVTYPRFLSFPRTAQIASNGADLIFELRVGRSGLGDDWLYKYTPNKGWSLIGKYLLGVNSELSDTLFAGWNRFDLVDNAYINGLDFDARGHLHVSWLVNSTVLCSFVMALQDLP